MILVFVQNAFLCFSSKTGSEVFSQEAHNLELLEKCAYGKFQKSLFHTENLATASRVFRD